MTGHDCSHQTDHNIFNHTRQSNWCFSSLLVGAEDTALWLYPGIQKFCTTWKRQEETCRCFEVMEIEIPANADFVGHCHVRHGAGQVELLVRPATLPLCHIKVDDSQDVVVLTYGASLGGSREQSGTDDSEASGDVSGK